MKTFYSVSELAEAVGYSVGTIQNKIRAGEIFAVQATPRGAFRIPASSFLRYQASLGIGPEPRVELLPPSRFARTTPDELRERDIEPVLRRDGYPDMPALLAAVERDPELYGRYEEVIRLYVAYLAKGRDRALARA